MEGALGYFGKHSRHWVFSLFRFHFSKLDHVRAVRGELSVEEEVHEVDLSNHIDEVERLADEEPPGVEVLSVNIGGEIVDEEFHPFFFALFWNHGAVEIEDEHFDTPAFPCLPEIARNIKENGLEEENETDPLVVLVILHFVLALDVTRYTRLNNVPPDCARQPVGNGEGGVDPAVGVHHIERDVVDDTVDGISDVLPRGDEERERHQDDDSRLVVESEHIVVYTDGVYPK